MTEPHVGSSSKQIAHAVSLDTNHANAFVIDAVENFRPQEWELSKRSDHPDATRVGGAAGGQPRRRSAKYQWQCDHRAQEA